MILCNSNFFAERGVSNQLFVTFHTDEHDAEINHLPPGGCFTFSIPLSMNPTSGDGPNDLGLIFLLSPVFLALLEPNTPRGPTAPALASSPGLLSLFAPPFFFVPRDDDDDDVGL